MALFDFFIQGHAKPGFRGCPFTNAAAELPDSTHPARSIINDHKVWLHNLLVRLATADGLDNKITKEKIVKDSLQPGITHTMTYQVPDNRTVANLLPEAPEVVAMPEILATGYMVGIIELACMQALHGYLDEDEITLGAACELPPCCAHCSWIHGDRGRETHGRRPPRADLRD